MNSTFNKFLWKTKIDVSNFTEGEEHYITLREPNTAEMKEIARMQSLIQNSTEEDETENIFDATDNFAEICSTLIVDHNFFTEEANPQKLPSKEVSAFLKSKIGLIQHIMAEYMTQLPLAKANAKK